MARHLIIEGLVQGVGYRYSFARQAEALGLTGWVRNRHDGAVEATVYGPAAALDAITAWAYRGPSAAQVERVITQDLAPDAPAPQQFEIAPNA